MYNFLVSDAYFAVNETWMRKWKDFLYSNKKFLKRNFVKGMPSPGPIENQPLMNGEEGNEISVLPNLKKVIKI